MNKRLFIYTSPRPNSVSSAVLDKIAKEGDTKFKIWEWELLKELPNAVDLKYGEMDQNKQELYNKIQQHKEFLDGFSEIFIASAMHNFGPSVTTKAYFDVLSQIGITFTYENGKPKGLLRADTKWTIVAASGGMSLESEHDHLFPWFKSLLSFSGVKSVEFLAVKGTLYPNFDIAGVPVPN